MSGSRALHSRRAHHRQMSLETESLAESLLKTVRLDGSDRPSTLLVARRWNVDVFTAPKTAKWGELAQTAIVGGRDRIYVRSGIDAAYRSIVVGHELGHIAARRWGLAPEDEEAWCWRFGAALLCPAATVRREWRSSCSHLAPFVAGWLEAPPTTLALRIAEVEEIPTWIVQNRRAIYTRAVNVPRVVLDVATESHKLGEAIRPGLRATRLGDAARRSAVLAA